MKPLPHLASFLVDVPSLLKKYHKLIQHPQKYKLFANTSLQPANPSISSASLDCLSNNNPSPVQILMDEKGETPKRDGSKTGTESLYFILYEKLPGKNIILFF